MQESNCCGYFDNNARQIVRWLSLKGIFICLLAFHASSDEHLPTVSLPCIPMWLGTLQKGTMRPPLFEITMFKMSPSKGSHSLFKRSAFNSLNEPVYTIAFFVFDSDAFRTASHNAYTSALKIDMH